MKRLLLVLGIMAISSALLAGCGATAANETPGDPVVTSQNVPEDETINPNDKEAAQTPAPAETKAGKETGNKTIKESVAAKSSTAAAGSKDATGKTSTTTSKPETGSKSTSSSEQKKATNSSSTSASNASSTTTTSGKTGLKVTGSGVDQEVVITLSEMQNSGQVVTYTYFSRAKDPKTANNTFKGVTLPYLLGLAGVKSSATKVLITGEDGYTKSFSLDDVNELWMDETDPSKQLPMMIAYNEDGTTYSGAYPFRLVMGQQCEGDYNRQYWVRNVSTITVK